jgi:hypothetical protein
MLYKLNVSNLDFSVRMQVKNPSSFGILEKHIEEFLRSRLNEVVSEDQLMLVGQERSFQEEADLLALDKNGVLYIFELKRWQSSQENILQVMRYGQIFGRYTYLELEDLAKRQQKLDGALKDRHREYFELDSPLPESKFNHDQVFVLVTNGVDRETISAINYWSKKGVKIEYAPYRIYDVGGQPYIQFDTYNPDDEILVEENTQFFIVNTNKSYMPDAWESMVGDGKKGKASAYFDRKNSVCKISKGSIVYLYHTGIGVVAKGVATSGFGRTDYEGDPEEEYYVPVKFEWALPDKTQWEAKAPRAWEINKRTNTSNRFRQTVFSISQAMADAVDIIAKERSGKINA